MRIAIGVLLVALGALCFIRLAWRLWIRWRWSHIPVESVPTAVLVKRAFETEDDRMDFVITWTVLGSVLTYCGLVVLGWAKFLE